MIKALDHVALVVDDLDAAVARYEALLGRAPNWRGADGGAHHAWFQLSNMALDVIAPTGPGYTGDRVKARLGDAGEGIWALAFTVDDMAETRHRLERVGVPSTDARPIRATHPDTGEKRYWTTSVAEPAATHGTNIFLIEEAPWPASPNTADEAAAVSGLDHVVVRTPNPDRAAALYGARLGLDMRLDRSSEEWGTRLMFFRCGDLVVEVAHSLKAGVSDGPDSFWGLSWRVDDVNAANARMKSADFGVSDVRPGRKPGTAVFTIRDAPASVP
ncbi:MAG TPA: VOC family protein, partial [Caulobacteraceae bacterium]|nr:VOC family protein [Caulobacteraceae bacterium]